MRRTMKRNTLHKINDTIFQVVLLYKLKLKQKQ